MCVEVNKSQHKTERGGFIILNNKKDLRLTELTDFYINSACFNKQLAIIVLNLKSGIIDCTLKWSNQSSNAPYPSLPRVTQYYHVS